MINPSINVRTALSESDCFADKQELFEPLKLMYDSLVATGEEGPGWAGGGGGIGCRAPGARGGQGQGRRPGPLKLMYDSLVATGEESSGGGGSGLRRSGETRWWSEGGGGWGALLPASRPSPTARLTLPLQPPPRPPRPPTPGDESTANAKLLDVLRQVQCFGLALMRLDIRQESTRHTEVMDAITQHLEMGSYAEWSEEKRLE
jgi:hypothetical protein